MMKKNQLAKAKDERAALDAEIGVLETELGLNKPEADQPTPAKQFQAERDSKPNPFSQK